MFLEQIGVDSHQRHTGLFAKEMAVPGVSRQIVYRSGQYRCDHRSRAGPARRVRFYGGRCGGDHGRRAGRGWVVKKGQVVEKELVVFGSVDALVVRISKRKSKITMFRSGQKTEISQILPIINR